MIQCLFLTNLFSKRHDVNRINLSTFSWKFDQNYKIGIKLNSKSGGGETRFAKVRTFSLAWDSFPSLLTSALSKYLLTWERNIRKTREKPHLFVISVKSYLSPSSSFLVGVLTVFRKKSGHFL